MELPYHEDLIPWGKGSPKCSVPDLELKYQPSILPHEKVLPQKFTSQITRMEMFYQLARERRKKKELKSLPEPAVAKYLFSLFLGQTLIPKKNLYFKKKSFQ